MFYHISLRTLSYTIQVSDNAITFGWWNDLINKNLICVLLLTALRAMYVSAAEPDIIEF